MDDKIKTFLVVGGFLLVLYLISSNMFAIYSIARVPFNVINVFTEKQPISAKECGLINGKCIPVEQKPILGTLEYGICTSTSKCVVDDKCIATGGKYKYKLIELSDNPMFAKYCACPSPLKFSLKEGCYREYV